MFTNVVFNASYTLEFMKKKNRLMNVGHPACMTYVETCILNNL